MVDAEFVESRRLTIEDVCRIFRVPPPAIGELSRATYSNISEQSRALITMTLRPWFVRIEQEMSATLLTEAGRRRYFIEHVPDGLLRGDQEARYAGYGVGRQWGFLSINDIRRLENMPAIGPAGDVFLQPANMAPAVAGNPAGAVSEGGPPEPRNPAGRSSGLPGEARADEALSAAQSAALSARLALRADFEPRIADIVAELVASEIEAVRAALEAGDFEAALTAFYASYGGDDGAVASSLRDTAQDYGEAVRSGVERELGRPIDHVRPFVNALLGSAGTGLAENGATQLLGLWRATAETQRAAAVQERMAEWQETRAPDFSAKLTIRIMEGAAHRAYRKGKVRNVRQVDATGRNSDRSIREPLVREGDDIGNGITASVDLFNAPTRRGDESVMLADD